MTESKRPPSVRRAALETFLEVEQGRGYSNLALKGLRYRWGGAFSEQEYAWIFAAVYGLLENLLYIDYMLAQFTDLRKQKPIVRGILRMGAYELLCMQGRVDVACNETVKLAKEVGKGALAGYVNGVLRAMARRRDDLPPLPEEPQKRLSIQYSWPEWIAAEWISRFGEEQTEALLRAMAEVKGISLRAQPPYTTEELEAWLIRKALPYRHGGLAPDCLHLEKGCNIAEQPLFKDGKISVQGEGAMLACRACGIQPGMNVLDACAAPGGKTAYLSALARGSIALHAWEKHSHRVELLQKTCSRLHVPAHIAQKDSAEYDPAYEGAFDVVLLDVPCSGFGTAGRKPEIKYDKKPEDIAALAEIQREILQACAKYVRLGGALVYASCTISEAENERQVHAFLQGNPAYEPDSLVPYLPDTLAGLQPGMIQLLPHVHDTEGFFIARMRRKAI